MDENYTTELGCDTPVTLLGVEGGTEPSLLVNTLHDLVAEQIANRAGPLTTKDIRFLRTYLGLNPMVFKKRLDLDENADITALPPEAEARLRYEVCQEIEGVETSLEELTALIAQSRDLNYRITIDVSNPNNYRVLLAA
ncbi:MAG: hypothetical protein V4682_01415 [Patescibacteria group bacterium]